MEINEIKQRLTLSMLLQHYGLKADKQNRLKCPFHNDKTPSLQLYYKTQMAYCFSTNCSTHGKTIDVIGYSGDTALPVPAICSPLGFGIKRTGYLTKLHIFSSHAFAL